MPRGTATLKRSPFPKQRADWPEAAVKAACWPLTPTRRRMKQTAHRLSRNLADGLKGWAVAVKKRDGYCCQWHRCEFCNNWPDQPVEAHHKALRSARPDLRLVLENGVTVCKRRHAWIHSEGRDAAIAEGFLDLTTYEAAAKERNGEQN